MPGINVRVGEAIRICKQNFPYRPPVSIFKNIFFRHNSYYKNSLDKNINHKNNFNLKDYEMDNNINCKNNSNRINHEIMNGIINKLF